MKSSSLALKLYSPLAFPHRPVKAIHVMSQIIQDVDVDPIHQQQMSMNLTTFEDILGGCERLLRAPIPVSYTRQGGH